MRNDHRTIMRTVVFTLLLVVGLAGYAMAQTPDGETPAEETVCVIGPDEENFSGSHNSMEV